MHIVREPNNDPFDFLQRAQNHLDTLTILGCFHSVKITQGSISAFQSCTREDYLVSRSNIVLLNLDFLLFSLWFRIYENPFVRQ